MTVASLPAARQANWTAPFFAGTVFISAALVFHVEPLFAKMILPQLGGSPAVWNACMAFFQAALLAGYLYAHLLQRLRAVSTQIVIHLCLLAAAALVLPIAVTHAFGPPPVGSPVIWLLCVLTVSIGAPFAVLSASAPLLQSWYARVSFGDADNPYILYSASNLGSMLALLAYPTFVEPLLTEHAQSFDWTLVYCGFGVLMAAVGAIVWRNAAPVQRAASMSDVADAPTWPTRFLWLALSAIPSSLMLGATTYISDDVASVPFLWVVPLALYLLTFVIAFQGEPLIPRERALLWQAVFVPMAAGLFCIATGSLSAHLLAYTGAFFFSALVCHQRLAASRPSPRHLTEFYLLLSLGGVLGGMFNAFLAPLIFSRVAEFPLVLALATMARPWQTTRFSRLSLAPAFAAIFAAAAAIGFRSRRHALPVRARRVSPSSAAPRRLSSAAGRHCSRSRSAPSVWRAVSFQPDGYADLLAARSFFGVYRVTHGSGSRAWRSASDVPRHDHPRRAIASRERTLPRHDLLCECDAHRSGHRGRTGKPSRGADRRGRSWRRNRRVLHARGRPHAFFRNRSRGRTHRARPALFHLSVGLRERQRRRRAGRRATRPWRGKRPRATTC